MVTLYAKRTCSVMLAAPWDVALPRSQPWEGRHDPHHRNRPRPAVDGPSGDGKGRRRWPRHHRSRAVRLYRYAAQHHRSEGLLRQHEPRYAGWYPWWISLVLRRAGGGIRCVHERTVDGTFLQAGHCGVRRERALQLYLAARIPEM